MDAAADPSKKFSHMFLMLKIRFVSIMVTTPFWVFLIRIFKTPTPKGQNGHFRAIQKCPKIGGLIPSFILAFGGFKRNIFDGFVYET